MIINIKLVSSPLVLLVFITIQMEFVDKETIAVRQEIKANKAEIRSVQLRIENVGGEVGTLVQEIKDVRSEMETATTTGRKAELKTQEDGLAETVSHLRNEKQALYNDLKALRQTEKDLRDLKQTLLKKEMDFHLEKQRLNFAMPTSNNSELTVVCVLFQ